MGAKFFCNVCGREIFQDMDQNMKETTTIEEIEGQCLCSDCERRGLTKKILSRKKITRDCARKIAAFCFFAAAACGAAQFWILAIAFIVVAGVFLIWV